MSRCRSHRRFPRMPPGASRRRRNRSNLRRGVPADPGYDPRGGLDLLLHVRGPQDPDRLGVLADLVGRARRAGDRRGPHRLRWRAAPPPPPARAPAAPAPARPACRAASAAASARAREGPPGRAEPKRLRQPLPRSRVAEPGRADPAPAHVIGGAGPVDRGAPAQAHALLARRDGPPADEADRLSAAGGRQGVPDVVDQRSHTAREVRGRVAGACDMSVKAAAPRRGR